jgi:hypothetical protein
MIIRYTQDIHSHQLIYAVCDAITGECYMETSSICDAIKLIQHNQTK